jgi:superfamily II DNA or RNA helicase
MSGVRPLPHQLEAVYQHILPQVRLRFLLADDPGAGKTIMAGLLLKELKLRNVIEKILILAPAPLTIQWQDELKSKFTETFEIVNSYLVKNQVAGNPWERFRQCITSIDFAKRDEVLPGILQVDWDLVIIDEAHKCSARTQGDDLRRTGRYKVAEALSQHTERILLLTATPHQGNVDQFHNFLKLIDPEQFISEKINPQILRLEDSPWFLRRIKEELKDFQGRKLFKERHAQTVPFELSTEEKNLYDQVTDYINRYLGKTSGRKQASVALARTVLQRRLASSLHAIFSSLKKRHDRFVNLLAELEKMTYEEQIKRLRELGRVVDSELDPDDFEEDDLDNIASDSTLVEEIDDLRDELQALKQLVKLAEHTISTGNETKLNALKGCLERSEFDELQSSNQGKLLIFTEHRDTLNYLRNNLEKWGYSVCEIHGGMNILDRKKAQRAFQFDKQICLATEAAGEGINLQFCRLMINYDIPWNPNRLEQRMGRIHRIGQPSDVYIFNFVSVLTVEGKVLEKLLTKLEEIRQAMGDRIFDVIGQILQLNNIQVEELIREATYNHSAAEKAYEVVDQIDPDVLQKLEDATGIALAASHIDLSQIKETQRQDYLSEELRLMPRYVEIFFERACSYLGIALDVRADGLWKIQYLKEEFRTPRLAAVRRLGFPDKNYPKFTFYKEHLERATTSDAEFVSPGHPLFAAIAERLDFVLADEVGYRSAAFVDADTLSPYRIHFFQVQVEGLNGKGKDQILQETLYAVLDKPDQSPSLIANDCLHDLAPAPETVENEPEALVPDEQKKLEYWLKAKVQKGMIEKTRRNQERELGIRQEYLEKAMTTAIRDAESKFYNLAGKVMKGDDTFRVARDRAQNKVTQLKDAYKVKQSELGHLKIVRPGRVTYLGSALVCPPSADQAFEGMRNDPEVEAIAMAYVMDYERQRGWTPEDVSNLRDGSGFDIRSVGPMDETTQISPVRRIEVKGRAAIGQAVSLTKNEWQKAKQLGDSYWLYVVWGCNSGNPQLITIQDPARNLGNDVKEVKQVTRYVIDGDRLKMHLSASYLEFKDS